MRTVSSITLAHKNFIVLLLAGIVSAALIGFSGAAAAGPAAPQAPQATCPQGGQCFADVLPGSPFYEFANNLYMQNIVSGYACGGPGEPCDNQNRPYYRPANSVTRAQMTKFVDLARTQPGISINTSTATTPLFSRTTASGGFGLWGESNNGSGVFGFSNLGSGINGTSVMSTGVNGISTQGAGVYGQSTNYGGVLGISDTSAGVYGQSNSDTGVIGVSNTGFAARFVGRVDVSGSITVSGNLTVQGTCTGCEGSTRIDHPLDPANKYLSHSNVESPDMMNIYNGNVTLDNKGEAVVLMPDWFEALNQEFRYQLTTIGGFAPVYIAEKVQGNSFKIAGGTPGLEVSWQVTGIRHDPYSEQQRTPVEQDKPQNEQGLYLHPDAYGQPDSKQIGHGDPPQLLNTPQP